MLTLGITIGFPLLVTIFAWDGIPQLRGLALNSSSGFLEQPQENTRSTKKNASPDSARSPAQAQTQRSIVCALARALDATGLRKRRHYA